MATVEGLGCHGPRVASEHGELQWGSVPCSPNPSRLAWDLQLDKKV